MTPNNPKKSRRKLNWQLPAECHHSDDCDQLDPSWSELAQDLNQHDRQYLTAVKQLEVVKPPAYHLIVCEEGRYPECFEFAAQTDLVSKLQELRAQELDAKLFMFRGDRLWLSKGPVHHLLIAGQEPIPLLPLVSLETDPNQNFSGLADPLPDVLPDDVHPEGNTLRLPAEEDWGTWGASPPAHEEELDEESDD